MLRYMLDSNLCIGLMRRPDVALLAKFKFHRGEMGISTIVLHELVHGAVKSARPDVQGERVNILVAGLSVLEFDAEAASHSGQIHAELGRKGQLIGAYDMLIAGHARSLGLTIVTNNMKDFTRVDGLRCEDWLAETAT